ncbi:MAG: hypothetical protein JF588_19235 [Caulobacterales bacterium]|nr:hypothetical protein [Caulobacterales bacterium]
MDAVDALKLAISHIEHMANWIGLTNRGAARGLYSFESIGEDMPGLKEALATQVDAAAALAVVRQSLVDQAAARLDPTMPILTPEVLESLKADAECAYAMSMDQKERVAAHGTLLLCEWQERAIAARNASPARTDDDAECCMACEEPFKEGDRYYLDVSGGSLHAACAGPEREGYVKDVGTGDPLGPDDPIPEPLIWTGEGA